jgi:hypothetical protein
MSRFTPEFEELADQFCEGNLSVEQFARLEALAAGSAEARKYLVESFQIHCELAWEFGRRGEGPDVSLPVHDWPVRLRVPSLRNRVRRWTVMTTALVVFVALLAVLSAMIGRGLHVNQSPACIARIEQTEGNVTWNDGHALVRGSPLPAGSKMAIGQGLVQLRLDNGVRIIVHGPAEIGLQSPLLTRLYEGSLSVDVPIEAHGFAIQTPNCTVTDFGTRFGVASYLGHTDVEVFIGSVFLRPEGPRSDPAQSRRLVARDAVRVTGTPGQESLKIESISSNCLHFVQSMADGSVALMQAVVASNPQLIHFYPFAGATEAERLRDHRGHLDLHEVIMRDGDGGGKISFGRTGPDLSTEVVATFRGNQLGATHGRGFQSGTIFQPPGEMTVEMLLRLSRVDKSQGEFVASALSTRHDREHCGFFVAALGDGELACLLDGGAEWLKGDVKFVPERWYYLAITFQADGANTRINAYVADLSGRTPALRPVIRDRTVLGAMAPGLLGVGKGQDGEMANAYPWPGELGHVAIYSSILGLDTLKDHLRAVVSRGHSPQVAP